MVSISLCEVFTVPIDWVFEVVGPYSSEKASPRISPEAITALQKVITGDGLNNDPESKSLAPYMSGPKLVAFFNQLGKRDEYGTGFGTRWVYVEAVLNEYNGTSKIVSAIESALHPRRYVDTPFSAEVAAEYFNKFLVYDGFEVRLSRQVYRVQLLDDDSIEVNLETLDPSEITYTLVTEQLVKCEQKIRDGDFDGAITNARTLVELSLLWLEQQTNGEVVPYDGDLVKLYKRVRVQLNLEPGRSDISETLKQILSGLISIIQGLGTLRNKMGDAHAPSYRASKHHAKLAVNVARTVTDFLFETFEYQNRRSLPKEGS